MFILLMFFSDPVMSHSHSAKFNPVTRHCKRMTCESLLFRNLFLYLFGFESLACPLWEWQESKKHVSSNAWPLRFQAFLSAPVESSLAKRWRWQEAAILEPWPTNKNNSALSQCLTKLTIIISHSHSATPWRQTLLQFYFGPRNGISVCARCLIQGSRFWKPIAIIERIWKDKILIDDNVDSSVFSVLPCSKHRTLSTWQPVAFQTMMHKINEICVWKICC